MKKKYIKAKKEQRYVWDVVEKSSFSFFAFKETLLRGIIVSRLRHI